MQRSFLERPRRGPGEGQSVRASTELQLLVENVFFRLTSFCEKRRGSEVFWRRQAAALERANPSVPLRSLKIYKNAFSKKKHQKMRITKARRILGPKQGRSRRGPNPAVPSMSLKFFITFWPFKCRAGPSSPPSLSNPLALT